MATETEPHEPVTIRFLDVPQAERRILIRIAEDCHQHRVGMQVADIPLPEWDAACSLIKRGFVDLHVNRPAGGKSEALLMLTATGRRVRDRGVARRVPRHLRDVST